MKCKWEEIPGWILLVCVLRCYPWCFRNFRINNMGPLFLRSLSYSTIAPKPKYILID